jgi:hypothetical protein
MSQASSRRPYLADAADVEQWAMRMMARSDLARLVRNLVRETNDQVTTLEMRGGEGTTVPGYDGIVEASKGTPFVPEGRSVWELGTGDDPTDKATDDYKKRTADPLGEDPSKTTFVFITPRRWPNKQKWIADRKNSSPWKAIKVFDVDDIEIALDQAPGTHHIFSDQIGKPAFGAQALQEWWKQFAAASNPRLTHQMALAGREDQAAALLQVLVLDVARTTIVAASTDDVLAFVAAAITSADADLMADLFGRALVIRDASALRAMDRTAKFLILLPFEESLHREAQLIQNHHVVLLAQPGMPATITVKELEPDRFRRLLRDADVPESRARALALTASRSLVAFQHEAAALGAVLRPSWTLWFASPLLRRAWLAGGWVELRSGDADVMAELIGQPLEASSAVLREAAGGEDPIFVAVASVWGSASLEATWEYVRPQLINADFAALERAIQEVLGAIDPRLELQLDQRWQAAIHGKSRVHSENLRKGLATTLALLGALGDKVQLGSGRTARVWAEGIVRQLLDRANADPSGQLWTSLSDVLPSLAEGAPEQFLRALHKGIEGADPVILKLFTDSDQTFTTSSAHPSLLWALEGLARSPEYFAIAMDALARLVELDPGGRLGNRPAATFVSVISPRFPQTTASLEARLAVLDMLRERHPAKSWQLTITALPGWMGVGTVNHAPRFRQWGPTLEQASPQEYWLMVEGIVDDLLLMVQERPELWSELIERIPDMPGNKRAEVYRRLRDLADHG